MKRTFWSATALAAIFSFSLFGGSASAQTTPPGQTDTTPRPVHFVGRVQSVTGSTLVLETRRGNVTANVSDRTWILVTEDSRCVEGDLTDIQVGQAASVAGMTTGTQGTINARMLSQGRCMRVPRPLGQSREKVRKELAKHLGAGTIKAINGSTLTLTNARGTEVTVNTTADTVVINNGFKPVSSLKVGEHVQVIGHPERPVTRDARTITAWAIRPETAGTRFFVGQVRSVSGNTVTLGGLKDRIGATVTFDSSTAFKTLGPSAADGKFTLTNATQADVKVGSNLQIEGVASSDGKTVAAKAVVILPSPKTRPAQP